MNFDNFIKGPLTSIFGLAMMCLAVYGFIWADWWPDNFSYYAAMFITGLVLLFMKDQIPVFVGRVFDKFFGKKDSPPQ